MIRRFNGAFDMSRPPAVHLLIIVVTISLSLMSFDLAFAQDSVTAEDLREGHRLAAQLCSICHLATPDQAEPPMRDPPAPPFEEILARKNLSAEWLTFFLETSHRGLDRPDGMPNQQLAQFQIKQIVAYLMSRHQK